MIKKIRRKFILIAMCSVFAVLTLIIGIINVVNYVQVVNNADKLVDVILDGNGGFGGEDIPSGGETERPRPPMSPETPFETRYFGVELNNDGQVVSVNVDKIVAVSEDEAKEYAVKLNQRGSTSGFYGNYRYGVKSTVFGGKLYIFVDCTRELVGFNNFLWISIAVGISGYAVVFLLVYVLSEKILTPITESYSKQKQFITDASHDIKTPLTIISADAEVLEMQHGSNEWTASIKSEVKRLTALTEKLVFLARMDEDNALKITDFSMSEAVAEMVNSFEAVALSHETPLVCSIQDNISYCGDEVMIRQLVSLLIDNAIKYSETKEQIEVKLCEVFNKLQLTVKNKNNNLPDGSLDYLFERFVRTDASRNSETGGHGIGLSVTQSIVNAHKGKITAKKEKGYVYFVVTL